MREQIIRNAVIRSNGEIFRVRQPSVDVKVVRNWGKGRTFPGAVQILA